MANTPRKQPAPAPLLKWAGGKRQLLKDILPLIPAVFSTYYEPFVGGGAVLFSLRPPKAVINDNNEELINLYRVVRDRPDELAADLGKHSNDEDYYYQLRDLDRDKARYAALSDVQRASRIIFLNKTCYNGLFRVNSSGQFNTPFGRYNNPVIANEAALKSVGNYLRMNEVEILNTDFEESLKGIDSDPFVYLDPPYDPASGSSNFTGYTKGGFDRDEQIRLAGVCRRLDRQGVRFLLSNSATDFIKDLYKGFEITIVSARRAVNSKAGGRGAVEEVLVRNYI